MRHIELEVLSLFVASHIRQSTPTQEKCLIRDKNHPKDRLEAYCESYADRLGEDFFRVLKAAKIRGERPTRRMLEDMGCREGHTEYYYFLR